ncbi:MAG: RRXRR domain-containing protein [Cyanobacteria bacterium J06642_11]
MIRVPVVGQDNKPIMPTKASRARRWVRDGKAVGKWDDLGNYYVQLVSEPSGTETQSIVVGVDPGKSYSGIGVQSAKATLFRAHIILPFGRVRARMDQRRLLRRGRRGRRIDRAKPFRLRNHRQKRFSNRRQGKLAPSIKASRDTELRVVRELIKVYPVTSIVYERVRADVDRTSGRKGARSGKGFSPVMVGQRYMLAQLAGIAPTVTREGWQKDGNGTSQIRNHLGLVKDKQSKSDAKPETHAVDGVALACGQFVQYRGFHTAKTYGKDWMGDVAVTDSLFRIVTRPGCVRRGKEYGVFRRQLHFEVPAKGSKRKRKGGTVTPWGFRVGDLVRSVKGKKESIGYIGGYSQGNRVVSLYDWRWKRIGQFSVSRTTIIRRSIGLCVA